jgi:hypothetical protein
MVEQFSTFCATKPIGTIGVVKTDFGFHIIEVMERDANYLPVVANVVKAFKPSQETIDYKDGEVYNLLYKLQAKIGRKATMKGKIEAFDTIPYISGLDESMEQNYDVFVTEGPARNIVFQQK